MPQGVSLNDPDLDEKLAKSDQLEKVDFEASVERGVQSLFKAGDDFVIWGPASVEIVDKEGDKISAEALDEALPQLLERARLSLEHSDQIVGRILERFETESPVTVEINGQTYERKEFPTDVLDLDDGEPAALYVAGEVFQDTQQSKRARERIEAGELNSYSISGEALVTRKKVEDGVVYDDIVDMDLSAVTLCEEGMNQGAKYAQVEGEVSDKDLAGEASATEKRQEVPVLEHPSMSGVSSGGAASEATPAQADPVNKNDTMSDSDPNEDETKSEDDTGATIEDVLERLDKSLPEGDIATKDDLDDVQDEALEAAEKAVDNRLPDGSLATVDAVEQMVDEKFDEKMEEADVSWNDPDNVESMTEGVEEPDTTTGPEGSADSEMSTDEGDVSHTSDKQDGDVDPDELEDPDDDGEDEMDVDGSEDDEEKSVEEKADSVRSARDKLANELGVDKDEVNSALTDLLEAGEGDYEEDDEDEEDDEVEMQDGEDHEDDEDEEEMENADGDYEEDDEEDDESMERLLERLEDELPEDVWKVVSEYMKEDTAEEDLDKAPESPADMLAGEASGAEESGDEDDLEKTVEEVLKGGAEAQGGTATPTDPEESQVDKQYSPQDDEDGPSEGDSPALQNFY